MRRGRGAARGPAACGRAAGRPAGRLTEACTRTAATIGRSGTGRAKHSRRLRPASPDRCTPAERDAPAGALLPALLPSGTADSDATLNDLAEVLARVDPRAPRILRPFDRREAITLKQAADIAGRSESALREWMDRYRIGRLVVGSSMISLPALLALLDDDVPALAAYLSGDRVSAAVRPYFERAHLGA